MMLAKDSYRSGKNNYITNIYEYVTKLLREKNKAIKFVETEHNTYPSAEEWRTALMDILRGDKE